MKVNCGVIFQTARLRRGQRASGVLQQLKIVGVVVGTRDGDESAASPHYVCLFRVLRGREWIQRLTVPVAAVADVDVGVVYGFSLLRSDRLDNVKIRP